MPDPLDFSGLDYEFMRPICNGWLEKIAIAQRRKKGFNDIAEQCMGFYSGATGFMWEDKFRTKYIKGSLSPKFKMTIAKAFEMVAVIGPVLYWKNPQRLCKARPPTQMTQEAFGPLEDPNTQMLFQQVQQQEQSRYNLNKTRASLMQQWLNYTPVEQPGGGLAGHSEQAITEALVKGMGLLWVEPYSQPGSERLLTGCFYDSVDNLIIDPDAETIHDAMWVAKSCTAPVWKVEREYGLPKGTIKANLESCWGQGEKANDPNYNMDREQGKTFDYVRYYKIWSKAGIGSRLSGLSAEVSNPLEEAVGDYAHVVVCQGVDFPLNAPSMRLKSGPISPQDAQRLFDWPIPYWKDDRWPFADLSFYRKPRSPWPIAPMSPGLGELVFMNVMMSHLANRIWSSSRDFIAVMRSASSNVRKVMENGQDQAIIEIDDSVHKSLNEVIQFLQQPQTNMDVWEIQDRMAMSFDKRVGLTELVYGLNPGGIQSRTAADINAKQENLSVRPDYMAGKVEAWQTEAARLEKFCTRMFIESSDYKALGGDVGGYLWQKLITDEPVEIAISEMDATVEAGSSRKPNKAKDAADIQALNQMLMPELSKHADMTFDTNPLNALIEMNGDAMDKDVSALRMGPRQPAPPPPEQQAAMQQQMDAQNQEAQAKLQGIQLKAQADQQKSEAEMAKIQMELQGKQEEIRMNSLMKMMEMRQAADKFKMEAEQDQTQFRMDMAQDNAQFAQDSQQQAAQGKQQLQLAKQQAALKPKPTSGSSPKR